jgi:thymidylate synthase
MATEERSYLDLLQRLIERGDIRDGRNGRTRSLFGERLEFRVSPDSFPLLTTKHMYWRGIVEELLWFLRGSTNAQELIERGVGIWTPNSRRSFLDSRGLHSYPESECGPIYGYQWRCFDGDYPSKDNGIDQIRYVIEELTREPNSRRAVLTAWNPKQIDQMCLPPCHVLYNFYLSETRGLSCQMYQRSCDTCAGLPFNIASTALLTTILAHVLHVPTDRIIMCIGDTHIYEDHLENAQIQVQSEPHPFPQVTIAKEPPPKDASIDQKLAWIESLTRQDFVLTNYVSRQRLQYTMVP